MLHRSKWVTVLLLGGGVAALAGAILYLVKREPAFYTQAASPDDWDSRDRATKLLTRVQDLKNDIRSKPEWGDTFTAADLNCFFAENMSRKGGLRTMLPEKLHSPRVAIDGDRLKLGFKYGEGFWSTVVWVELRIWLVKDEVNLVGVEVCDLRAGCIGLGTQTVLDSITEWARESNIEATWYRSGANPVGLFRFYADQPPPPTTQILTLDVKDGTIVVAGRSALNQSPVGRVE